MKLASQAVVPSQQRFSPCTRAARLRTTAVYCAGGTRTHYNVLGVPKSASCEQLKAAYRRKALELHPDRNKSADANRCFMECTKAYETLCNAHTRATYDMTIDEEVLSAGHSWLQYSKQQLYRSANATSNASSLDDSIYVSATKWAGTMSSWSQRMNSGWTRDSATEETCEPVEAWVYYDAAENLRKQQSPKRSWFP